MLRLLVLTLPCLGASVPKLQVSLSSAVPGPPPVADPLTYVRTAQRAPGVLP